MLIIFILDIIFCIFLVLFVIHKQRKEKTQISQDISHTFSVSKYLERTEKAYLEILEDQEPVDTTIILWWGLDGLRLNQDGTTEWISRKKKKEQVTEFYHAPVPGYLSAYNPGYNFSSRFDFCNAVQSTQDQINQLQMSIKQNTIQSIRPPQYLNFIGMENCCCNPANER